MSCPREVNTLLHALRGEQYRRAQNAKGSRTYISMPSLPSLPRDLSKLDYDNDTTDPPPLPTPSQGSLTESCAGPGPPKSWKLTVTTPEQNGHETPKWRAQALSLIFLHTLKFQHQCFPRHHHKSECASDRLPPLTMLCLQRLLFATTSSEFAQLVAPYLPFHLRRELVRNAAVHMPLPYPVLFSLLGKEDHVAGELLVVGPNTTLPESHFPPNSSSHSTVEMSKQHHNDVQDDWDTDETPELLNTLILLSCPLSSSTFLRLPATITHMALIDLPGAVPLFRLPTLCPLLAVLDLSYNTWLAEGSPNARKIFDKVDWCRWIYLKVLGLRECHIPEDLSIRLNKDRWDDVQVVQWVGPV